MRDKNQILMFSEAELTLIKNVFADNEELIYAIRNVLLQFPLSKTETEAIKAQITPEVHALIVKRLVGNIGTDATLTEYADLYQTLNTDIKTKTVDEMAPLFEAKKLEIEYIEQQIAILLDLDKEPIIRLDDLKVITNDHYRNYINTTARNFILGYVGPFLNFLKAIAGTRTESLEKQKERLTRNSSK